MEGGGREVMVREKWAGGKELWRRKGRKKEGWKRGGGWTGGSKRGEGCGSRKRRGISGGKGIGDEKVRKKKGRGGSG